MGTVKIRAMLESLLGSPLRRRGNALLLTSERILLRPLVAADAPAMLAFVCDPEVTRFLPWQTDQTLDSVEHFIADQIARRRRGESLALALVLRETGALIGSTDLMDRTRTKGQAEMGYLLARPYWNRGLMTEAAHLTLNYAFASLPLNRVIAWADEANTGSRRVLEKLGMHCDGSENRLVKGETRPYVRYAVTRADYEAITP